MQQPSGGRWRAGCLAAGTALLASAALAFDGPPPEYAVKAAYLLNFARFVEWPAAPPGTPLLIGVVGQDPFGPVLDNTAAGRKVSGRPVTVRRFPTIANVQPCDILFVAGSEEARLGELLARIGPARVLIVGDTARMATAGGSIGFYLDEGHVRFVVNPGTAEARGLKISARMLSLGQVVDRKRKAGP